MTGIRTISDVSTVARNAGFTMSAHAADIHAELRYGLATVYVRDDLCGGVETSVRCPGWAGDVRLPAGVPLDVVAVVVDAARDAVAARSAS